MIMPIIEDVSYSAASTTKAGKEIILHYPQFGRNKLGLSGRSYTNSKRSGSNRMHRNENNIRTRKFNQSWVNDSGVFKIGEVCDHRNLAISLPQKSTFGEVKYHKRPQDINKETVKKKALHQIESYCEKSTLHGLRYVGDSSLSLGERMFWLVSFAGAIGFAAYYIQNIYVKWNTSPVIISFSPFDTPLNEIPFPAITICNMNQAKKTEALRILKEGSQVEKKLLNDYCTNNNSFSSTEDSADWDTLLDFLVKTGNSCSDILKTCYWQNDKVNCDDFFNNDLTDEGMCCSFNRLPPKYIFRNPNSIAGLNLTYSRIVDDWNPEDGFKDPTGFSDDVTPRRPAGTGTHLGLTLVLDTHVDDYFCSSTDSVGFKMIFSNPIENPKMADFGFLIGPGVEARYIITPDIKAATQQLRYVAMEKRRCYFLNERPLYYFRSYTMRNCRLECQANYTWSKCDCVPYYLPRNKHTIVCGKRDEICSNQAKEDMELILGNGTSCQCWPGCFELNYDKSGSYSALAPSTVKLKYDLENVSRQYFLKNMVVSHFYFRYSQFRKQIKSEIYGFTEVLSNVGGLLGLCMGFSFLSLIELVYFVTLRLLCGFVQRKRKAQKLRNSRDIPFAQ